MSQLSTSNKFTKKPWHYYAITSLLVTIFFVTRETDVRVVGHAGRYGLGLVAVVIITVITFGLSVDMGFENIRNKWLYPIFVVLLAHVILPSIAYATYDDAWAYMFLRYMFIIFLFYYSFNLLANYLGIAIGVLIRRRLAKKEQDDNKLADTVSN